MQMLRINTQDAAGRGTVITGQQDGNQFSFAVINDLPKETETATTRIKSAINNIATAAEEWNKDLTVSGLQKRLRDHLSATASPFQSLIEIGVVARQQAAEWNARFDELPEDYDAQVESEIRRNYRSLDAAGRMRFIQSASISELAAVLRAGRAMVAENENPSINRQMQERYRRLSFMHKTAVQAKFAGKPSAANPFAAASPDYAAAESFANDRIREVQAEWEKTNNLEQFICRYTVAVSVMAGIPVDRAFSVLMGEASWE